MPQPPWLARRTNPSPQQARACGRSAGGQAAEVILRADPEVDAVIRGSDQIAAGLVEAARER
ncbi:hypothetical protein ACGFIJ_06615 [Microbispora bryophytorum]|uniref:hypothetical protein n=1 Tax=Microbispora bryophytorum TaxID=1460882 RepID=UPI00371C074F